MVPVGTTFNWQRLPVVGVLLTGCRRQGVVRSGHTARLARAPG